MPVAFQLLEYLGSEKTTLYFQQVAPFIEEILCELIP